MGILWVCEECVINKKLTPYNPRKLLGMMTGTALWWKGCRMEYLVVSIKILS